MCLRQKVNRSVPAYKMSLLGLSKRKKLISFLQYVETDDAVDDFTRLLEREVRTARLNEEWRSEYLKTYVNDMDMRREGYEEGILAGEEQGRKQGRAETLKELICNLMESEHISEEEAKKLLKIQ